MLERLSVGIHTPGIHVDRVPSSQGPQHFSLSGRLAPAIQLASSSSGASSGIPPDHSGVRFSHQLEEVVSYPPENSFLSGSGSRISSSSCSPHGTQNLGSLMDCSRPDLQAHFLGPNLAEIPGPSVASFVDLIPNCRLLMRPLQLHFLQFFSPCVDSPSKSIPMTPLIRTHCLQWSNREFLLQGKPFSFPQPDVSLSQTLLIRAGVHPFPLGTYREFGLRRKLWATYIFWNSQQFIEPFSISIFRSLAFMFASFQTMQRPFHTSTFKEELIPILFPP